MKFELSVNLYYSIIGPNTEFTRDKNAGFENNYRQRTKTKYLNFKLLDNNISLILFHNRVPTGAMEIVLINIFMFKYIYSTIRV